MATEENYIVINRNSWNSRVDAHVNSEFYDVEGFLKGKRTLNEIELGLLGNIQGKSVLHLQCHFGMDTLSLGQMGGKVTGMDFSNTAIDKARELSVHTNIPATFICCDLYDLPAHLSDTFDIVYTSYGTIGWLPDLDRWATIISTFLKPGGKFVFVEFHPVVWMFDDFFKEIKYNYFKSDSIHETESGTYADRNAQLNPTSVTWNHGLGEVLTSLIKKNLMIEKIGEYDYSPYQCFQKCIEFEKNKYRIEHFGNKIPMVYSLVAVKRVSNQG